MSRFQKFLITAIQYLISLKTPIVDAINEISEEAGKFFQSLLVIVLILPFYIAFLPFEILMRVCDKYTILNEVWKEYNEYRKSKEIKK